MIPQQSVRPTYRGHDATYQPAAVRAEQDVEVTGEERAVGGQRHGRRTRVVVDVQADVVVLGPQLEAHTRVASLHGVAARETKRDRRAQAGHRIRGSQTTEEGERTAGMRSGRVLYVPHEHQAAR